MQTKLQSVIEVTSNKILGFFWSLGVQIVVLDGIMGTDFLMSEHVIITALIVGAAWIKSYFVRRFFNWYWSDKP